MNNEQFVYRIWNTKHKTYIRTTSGKTIWASKQAASSARTYHYGLSPERKKEALARFEIHKFRLVEVTEND